MSSEDSQATKLSIVIIGRNEEQFIAKSIRSALAATAGFPGSEVIFVDSASTDKSIDIAIEYPIRILQLKPEWPLCVAAGRYTGFRHAHGEYVLFLDGDAEIEANWVSRAIDFMDAHTQYGGIAGVLDEKYVDASGVDQGGRQNVRQQDLSKSLIDCKTLGGIALFRSLALQTAGTVNPHLPTAEDHELCLRIRNCGFKLARISGRMCIKYTEQRDTLREILRRSRTKMYDYGAVIRYSAVYGAGVQFCLDAIPYLVTFVVTALLLMVSIPLAIYFDFVWLILLIALVLCLAVAIKKRSLRLAFLSIAKRSVSTLRTIVSFVLTKPLPIEAYPTDVIQVR